MEIFFASAFLRMFKVLPEALQQEAKEKIAILRDPTKHKLLKVHKLSGRLEDRYSFSVNYKTRIVFCDFSKHPKAIVLLAIGDHDIYDR